MPLKEISENEFFDMFNLGSEVETPTPTDFKTEPVDTDIFEENKPEVVPPAAEEVKPPAENLEDIDIFAEEGEQAPEGTEVAEGTKPGRKPKYDFSDAAGYFEDRIKQGKFVAVNEEVDGVEKPFVPRTPEEFDEFIDINLNHKLSEKQKELEDSWFETKSPAWKAIAKFADQNASLEEVASFISGVKTINEVAKLDENTVDGAEEIYRAWLTKRGEPAGVIEKQVELAKTSDQLTSLAASYKPLLVQAEQQNLARMEEEKAAEEQRFFQVITENRNKAIEAIESPIFGKQKLKDDEKALVYDLIAAPSQEAGGYKIYEELDKLYQNKDFGTLREVALLLGRKDSYLTYASNNTKQENAAGLLRTLKVANAKPATTTQVEEVPKRPAPVQRQQVQNTNAFSRR